MVDMRTGGLKEEMEVLQTAREAASSGVLIALGSLKAAATRVDAAQVWASLCVQTQHSARIACFSFFIQFLF
eukprot:COSAG05_NODE_273_length_12440_cov_22.182805_12_plen_72_part_00